MRLSFVMSNRISILVDLIKEEFVGGIFGLEYICVVVEKNYEQY